MISQFHIALFCNSIEYLVIFSCVFVCSKKKKKNLLTKNVFVFVRREGKEESVYNLHKVSSSYHFPKDD